MTFQSSVKKGKRIKSCRAVFPGYEGNLLWEVSHPDYKEPVKILAPDPDAATQEAAKLWRRRWQDIAFYAYCFCRKL